jgi:SAM-dependent methyltransferase
MVSSLLLRFPRLYSLFGAIVGGDGRSRFVQTHVRPEAAQKILDIGCGPADILAWLPEEVAYVGFDESRAYVAAARRRFGARGTFRCARVTRDLVGAYSGFDVVLALGVLHHLDDAECRTLLEIARLALRPGGRLVTLDGCFVEQQGRVARWLLKRDRGTHVRTEDAYLSLVRDTFPDVRHQMYSDLIRLPYTHIVMECMR